VVDVMVYNTVIANINTKKEVHKSILTIAKAQILIMIITMVDGTI